MRFLNLIGEVGADHFTAPAVLEQLRAARNSPVHFLLDSPGGSAWAGLAICTAMRRHRARVTVSIGAMAASAASVIAMGADEVLMGPDSMLMLHAPKGAAVGGAGDMRQMATLLDRVHEAMVSAYAHRLGADRRDEIAAWLNAETWFTADEAIRAGLADRIEEAPKIAAAIGGRSTQYGLNGR